MKKIILNLILTLILINLSFGVSVVENAPVPTAQSGGVADVIAGAVVMGMGLGIVIGTIIFIIWAITSKIREAKRKHSDLLYSKFSIELEKCHQNRDQRLKYRSWKTFFLTFKRHDIVLDTTEEGIKVFGKYDGEVIIKDNFVLVAVYRVTGIFTREKDIIIVPYKIRSLIKKEKHNGKFEILIKTESVDEALNTDYYAQLVVKDHKDNNKLINFNEYIQKQYMEKFVMRQVIKDDLLDFKESMSRAVEINPNIQTERKNPKN